MTLALSIRAPFAWAILHAGKDRENRSWPTKVRGRVLIHCGEAMSPDDYSGAMESCIRYGLAARPPFPTRAALGFLRGGIVGEVEIVDCITESVSPWFSGRYGFVLHNAKPLPFVIYKGRLGFFEVDEAALYSGST